MRLSAAFLVLLLALAVPVRAATCAEQKPLTLSEYSAELERFKQTARQLGEDASLAGKLLPSIPMSCAVVADGERIDVSFTWLRAAFVDVQRHSEHLQTRVSEVSNRLSLMEAQAQGYAAAGAQGDARSRLTEILGRREFQQVHQPSILDVWRERLWLAILYALEQIFSRVHISPRASDVLTWGVVGALFALAVFLVGRAILRGQRRPPAPDILAFARRSAPDWLRLAREAERRGAYREAVHHAYWAAVRQLEEGGAWRPDRARTPREYLRVLPQAHSGWRPLASLTRRFEGAWYGNRPVSQPEFAEVVGELEKLGCRSN